MAAIRAGATEASIAAWLVQVGDPVEAGDPLVEIETEKASVEVESDVSGTVRFISAQAGDVVQVGDTIAVIGMPRDSEDDISQAVANIGNRAVATVHSSPSSEDQKLGAVCPSERTFASPLVRKLVRENGLNLDGVTGTGPGGRVIRRDLADLLDQPKSFVVEGSHGSLRGHEETLPRLGPADASELTPDFETLPLSPMRRAIARRLLESKTTVPHFYLQGDADMTHLVKMRARINEKTKASVSLNDFILKAAAKALIDVPEMNRTWTDQGLRVHLEASIAVAVALGDGLVTPVVKAVDAMPLSRLSRETKMLTNKARAGTLSQNEIEGGSFTVSNLGMYGVSQFSAIINPPHAGILAVGSISDAVIARKGKPAVRPVCKFTLSVDHRIADGAVAARWMRSFISALESPIELMV